jgi:hypothetical protein
MTVPSQTLAQVAPVGNRWRFALTKGRVAGVIIEMIGALLPFAGCYLAFSGHAHVGIYVAALGLMATTGLIVQAERHRGDPRACILRDAQAFRDTPHLAVTQRTYDQHYGRRGSL